MAVLTGYRGNYALLFSAIEKLEKNEPLENGEQSELLNMIHNAEGLAYPDQDLFERHQRAIKNDSTLSAELEEVEDWL